MRLALPSLVLALALAACGPEPATPPPSPEAPAEAPPTAPETRPDTLWIEGNAEPIVARRYAPAAAFPLRFWTYLPPDWQAETVSGDAVQFTPIGPLEGEATLTVRVYPEGTTEADALEEMEETAGREALRNRQVAVVSDEPMETWALREIVLADGDVAGRVVLGEHAGRYVEVSSRYPVEAGDGFGPRAHYVLDAWRWADTGAPLGGDQSSRSQP